MIEYKFVLVARFYSLNFRYFHFFKNTLIIIVVFIFGICFKKLCLYVCIFTVSNQHFARIVDLKIR